MRVLRDAFSVILAGLAAISVTILAARAAEPAVGSSCVEGLVWQLDIASVQPFGDWDRIGAKTLLVQWTVVDGKAFIPGLSLPQYERQPDWWRIASEPWASRVILGLSGRFSESEARANAVSLVALSAQIASLPTPLNVVGYYLPIEADPTWQDVKEFGRLLNSLPRPLWVSAYTAGDLDPQQFADWVADWLPNDVGLFFQDGVGAQGRAPEDAAAYAVALKKKLGPSRLGVILEAFRSARGAGFRPATPAELKSEIAAMQGFRCFVFDGPHFLSQDTVKALGPRP